MTAMAADATSPSQPVAKKPFTFVREHGERATEINDFYNRFMNLRRPMEAYTWEFQRGPGGPALIWTIIEAATDRVVGHHSIVKTPMLDCGAVRAGGRTENTIIEPAVRTKIFYPGMEKRALAEALQDLSVIYTIHSKGPGRLRERLGYKPVGRWVVYLPRIGAGYLQALARRIRDRLPYKLPDAVLSGAAAAIANLHSRVSRRRLPPGVEVREIGGISAIGPEYDAFWTRARAQYDVTIDRSLEFMRWRTVDNPHLAFRTWTIRRGGELLGLVVGHRHAIGDASALYIDDIIVGPYDETTFDVAVAALNGLDPDSESVVVMTLAVDTPLHRVLRRRMPWQARALDRFGEKLFDEMLAFDRDHDERRPWYVTAIFTEGMDTSRDSAG